MPKLPARPIAPRRESDVTGEVRAYLAREAIIHWRNTVGFIRQGDIAPRAISYGLCPGSADLIACVPTRLACPSCGASLPPIGRFVGVEVKGPQTRTSPEQFAWASLVAKAHGVAGFAHEEADVVAIVQRARRTW